MERVGYYITLYGTGNGRRQLFSIRSEENHLCPACQRGTLKANGRRMRSVIDVDGNLYHYLVRRLKCPICNRIHHELPNFIVPYKQYCVQVIEAAIEGEIIDLPCYDNTIVSFQHWFASIADKMVLLLRAGNSIYTGIPQSVSPLPLIKEMYGAASGWLAWAVGQTVQDVFLTKTTRLLC